MQKQAENLKTKIITGLFSGLLFMVLNILFNKFLYPEQTLKHLLFEGFISGLIFALLFVLLTPVITKWVSKR